MVKYYLIPETGDGKTRDSAFRPKYLDSLKINNSCIHFPAKHVFLVIVNTVTSSKITSLTANADVIDITTNTASIRNKISSTYAISLLSGDDIPDKIGKLKEPSFVKSDFYVISN